MYRYIEYWNDEHYESYLKNHLSQNYNNPEDLSRNSSKESYKQWNDRVGNQFVNLYEKKLKEIYYDSYYILINSYCFFI